ncbi:MAG: outer membrane protein assembly factor BamA [Syntrophobacteria bacterium]
MKFQLVVVLVILSLICPWPLYGSSFRLAIIPLDFHTEEDLSSLRPSLMRMLVTGLEQQGLQPVPAPKEIEKMPEVTYEEMNDAMAREIGQELESRFALYGSLTKIGEQISLDVRLVDVEDRRPTASIYVTRMGLENLASGVADLAGEVAIRIFRKKKIHQITVTGNRRIEEEAIKLVIESKSGDVFDPVKLREDLKAIYKMGYFKDVRIESEDTPQGKDVVFVVTEKPTIGKVLIRGTEAVSEEDIRTAITTKAYSILQRTALKEDVEKIRSLYRDKGYYNAEVTFEVEPYQEDRVAVTFEIEEHDKLYIREVSFSGNHQYSDDELRDQIATSKKGFFSWFTGSGILKREQLEVDVDRLASFYHNHGFINARVGSPTVTYDEKGIYVQFPVSEGRRFRVGKVTLAGEGLEAEGTLMDSLRLPKEEYFSREALARDLETISDFYSAQGYAFAEARPQMSKDARRQVVDVVYEVGKGDLVYFDRITISGNTKTRDKVIRRELYATEKARYDRAKLERSVRNLRRLDFFEKVDVNTSKGDEPNELNVNVEVEEKPTRFMSVGAGFSSADEVFLMGQIAEQNLGGRGQNLQFQGQLGTVATRYRLKFTEPWLFDIPLSTSLEAYNWLRDYDEFDKESYGARLGGSYPVWDYSRLYLSYAYDSATVKDLDPDVSTFIKEQEGTIVSSIISSTLRRDSRDHFFLPTRGSDNSIRIDYAGQLLGGDASYVKVIFNSGWYFPLLWDCVGFLHGKVGYAREIQGGILPIYDRFFLGGINSIRSFETADVSPRDPETGDRIGGNKMALFNAEFLFPISKERGIRGLVFFDAGNAFDDGEEIDVADFKTAVGVGVRWHSPMGPLRLEWGYNLDPEPHEDSSNWQFSMGAFF